MPDRYRPTMLCCYLGYVTQAVVVNLAPILFIVFQSRFGLSYERLALLVVLNFCTQIVVDVLGARYGDRLGFRRCMQFACVFVMLGLAALGALPGRLLPPYAGLCVATTLYSIGGGLLEVVVSPITEAVPSANKAANMSLLHSFYAWGQVAVVLFSTLFLAVFSQDNWRWLPLLWALVPLVTLVRLAKAPMPPNLTAEQLESPKRILKSPVFFVALLVMVCAGAAEQSMAQWASLFAEKGLEVNKTVGDLLGPCLFAALLGAGRVLNVRLSSRLSLTTTLTIGSGLAVGCYLLAAHSPWPPLGLFGCALCGLAVSVMWPGTLSLVSRQIPNGGTFLFGAMAVFGDVGCSLGPWITGLVSDRVVTGAALAGTAGLGAEQLGLRAGLLAAIVFPLGLLLCALLYFRRRARAGSGGPASPGDAAPDA